MYIRKYLNDQLYRTASNKSIGDVTMEMSDGFLL